MAREAKRALTLVQGNGVRSTKAEEELFLGSRGRSAYATTPTDFIPSGMVGARGVVSTGMVPFRMEPAT